MRRATRGNYGLEARFILNLDSFCAFVLYCYIILFYIVKIITCHVLKCMHFYSSTTGFI